MSRKVSAKNRLRDILLAMPDRKAVCAARREKMLSEKVDYAKWLTWFIENYPASVADVRAADEQFWARFK